jgi:hypothetical protein
MSPLDFSFPIGVRHASTVRVTQGELDALRAHYGVVEDCRIRTRHEQDGQVYYAGHSWFHGVITPREEAADRGALNDLRWRIRPGLANPLNPSLVSIEAAGRPGEYLHVDGSNIARYPVCDEPSVRGYALCWPAADQRTHLTWIDAEVDTTEFAEDATFRRVAALNGDPAMVSFQWVGDPSLYLRHQFYQLFLRPRGTTAQDANDASFAIEPW